MAESTGLQGLFYGFDRINAVAAGLENRLEVAATDYATDLGTKDGLEAVQRLPDGSLAPWKSPDGKDMELAVAAPIVPPTDFAYSLVPNGRTLDYAMDSPYLGPDGKAPYGVMKAAIINALFGAGDNFSGQNGPVNPLFDVVGWRQLMSEGEPYDTAGGQTMVSEMTQHHSSYYVDDSVEPAPMVIAEGLTDDLFPIDEALRFYNRTKHNYPGATVGLLFADIGHPRAPLAGEFSQGREEDKEMGFQIARKKIALKNDYIRQVIDVYHV